MKVFNNTGFSKFILIFLCLSVTLLISFIQYLAGPELSLTLFYIFPIILVTWKAGIWAGILISFSGAVLWLATDIIAISMFANKIIPYLNAVFRLMGFLIITYIVSELKNSMDSHKDIARTDPLTGIANKRAFYESAVMELYKARRLNRQFSVLCIDLDNFKQVNDTFGHHTGDVLLKTVAACIKTNIRQIDMAGRLGGDEFGILLSEAGAESAYTVAGKLQKILLEEMKKNKWPVTFSIGAATFLKPPESVEDMLKKADILMYTAKKNGKNMIKHMIISE